MQPGATTLREIFYQPEVWRRCQKTLDTIDLQSLVGDKEPRAHEWIFVGCGTRYYLTQSAAATLIALLGGPARALPAYQILLFPKLAFPVEQAPIFPVLISRSGNTSEILRVAELCVQRGIEFLVVTCDGNELARLGTRTLALPATDESVVMTSTFTSMLMALQYLPLGSRNETSL